MLYSIENRIQQLLFHGFDTVVVQEFSRDFSALTANEFLSEYLAENFPIKVISVGYDLTYGHDRRGNYQHLAAHAGRYGWNVYDVDALELLGEPVSSSRRMSCGYAAMYSR